MLGSARLHQHTSAMLHSPSDDHLLGNAVTLLANLPDDGVLHIPSARVMIPHFENDNAAKDSKDVTCIMFGNG